MIRRLGVLLTAALLLGGCQAEPGDVALPGPSTTPEASATPSVAPSATSPTSQTTEPTPSPSDTESPSPLAVPDELDGAYIEQVLDELDEALTPGIVASAEAATLTPDLERRMEALWTDEWVETIQPAFEAEFEESSARIDDIETRYHDIGEIVVADDDCIIVRSSVDFGAWLADDTETPQPGRYVTALVPRPDGDDTGDINPTAWLVNYDQELEGDLDPDELC